MQGVAGDDGDDGVDGMPGPQGESVFWQLLLFDRPRNAH